MHSHQDVAVKNLFQHDRYAQLDAVEIKIQLTNGITISFFITCNWLIKDLFDYFVGTKNFRLTETDGYHKLKFFVVPCPFTVRLNQTDRPQLKVYFKDLN